MLQYLGSWFVVLKVGAGCSCGGATMHVKSSLAPGSSLILLVGGGSESFATRMTSSRSAKGCEAASIGSVLIVTLK